MSSAGQILVVVPDLGDSVTEATLTHWLAAVGTIVEPGEAIAEVEAEKVNIEIPVDTRVRIDRHLVAEGDRVTIGAAIAEVTPVDQPASRPGQDCRSATDDKWTRHA